MTVQMTGSSGTSGGGAVARGMNALYAGAICLLFLVGSPSSQTTTSTYEIGLPADQTDSRPRAPWFSEPSLSTGQAVLEIRRRSSLTWEELGSIFGVSRRSVHNWANGDLLAAKNEHHVRAILSVVRQLDRGDPRRTRDALLMVNDDGINALTLLRSGDFAGALELLRKSVKDLAATNIQVPTAFRSAQYLPRATAYLDAIDASAAPSSGKSRIARVYRASKA